LGFPSSVAPRKPLRMRPSVVVNDSSTGPLIADLLDAGGWFSEARRFSSSHPSHRENTAFHLFEGFIRHSTGESPTGSSLHVGLDQLMRISGGLGGTTAWLRTSSATRQNPAGIPRARRSTAALSASRLSGTRLRRWSGCVGRLALASRMETWIGSDPRWFRRLADIIGRLLHGRLACEICPDRFHAYGSSGGCGRRSFQSELRWWRNFGQGVARGRPHRGPSGSTGTCCRTGTE
jgi:hypothetical protein